MTNYNKTTYISTFEKEVKQGLTTFPKFLSSKYIYDEKGDKLFQDIMAMPSYYLYNSEYEVIDTHKDALATIFTHPDGFDLIELGAGDGQKTKVLLKHLVQREETFTYLPIDISQNALDGLKKSIQKEIPKVHINPKQGTYFEVLSDVASYKTRKKVIMVLGSNIGNLLHPQAIDFLSNIREAMGPEDLLFMGFDQKKDPQRILDAYNDPDGITEAFNKNILHRINKEMDANFEPDNFKHWEVYNPESGTAKSYLVSTRVQEVDIKKLDMTVKFDAWESIHTEISQKYDDKIVSWLAKESGLEIAEQYWDKEKLYKNYLFSKKK